MAIKVQFPVGASDVTVRGLYQWDYGQTLEIECSEIGSEIVEVHFACANMAEAIVRTCTFSNGIGTVKIPDECLEQTSAVTSWICKVDSTQRHTIKTIVLPLTARTRPSNIRDIPTDYVDVYGQLIEEVNEAINALEKGDITAAKAHAATSAERANTAGSAASATYATSAGSANTANTAAKATTADVALSVAGKHAFSVSITDGEGETAYLTGHTIYYVDLVENGIHFSGVLAISGYDIVSLGMHTLSCIRSSAGDKYTIYISNTGDSSHPTGTLYFYKIGELR